MNLRNLLNGNLSSCNNSACPKVFKKLSAIFSTKTSLSAYMYMSVWKIFSYEIKYTKILYYKCINSIFYINLKIFIKLSLYLSILKKSVYSKIRFSAMKMAVFNSFLCFVYCKVLGIGSSAKQISTKINSICTCIYNCFIYF